MPPAKERPTAPAGPVHDRGTGTEVISSRSALCGRDTLMRRGCGEVRGSAVGRSLHKIQPCRGPHVIACRAILDVPRELVIELARLLRAGRRSRGTRKRTRLLTWFKQALLV